MFLRLNKMLYQILTGVMSNLQYRGIYIRSISILNDRFRSLKAPWKILFFGSDDFSEASLKILHGELLTGAFVHRIDVVTSLKPRKNPVQTFALQNNLKLHDMPYFPSTEEFDVGVVVSFGHLIPERVIASFPFGMLNVHASLLPRWRGAAPIIHAILNGDTTTGVTIMKIKPKKFDVGDIVKQASCSIHPDETLPQLHSRLAVLGARLLLECVRDLPHCLAKAVPQPLHNVTYAPKVGPAMAAVRWRDMTSVQVYNLHRAIGSLYPLRTCWHSRPVKLFCAALPTNNVPGDSHCVPGSVRYLRSADALRVMCADSRWIHFKAVGLLGKRPATAAEFNNGSLSKMMKCDQMFS